MRSFFFLPRTFLQLEVSWLSIVMLVPSPTSRRLHPILLYGAVPGIFEPRLRAHSASRLLYQHLGLRYYYMTQPDPNSRPRGIEDLVSDIPVSVSLSMKA